MASPPRETMDRIDPQSVLDRLVRVVPDLFQGPEPVAFLVKVEDHAALRFVLLPRRQLT